MRIKVLRLFTALLILAAIVGTYLPDAFAENKKVILNMDKIACLELKKQDNYMYKGTKNT
jgi:stringent starvation protein B